MPATPRRSRRFGGDAAHQRLMMANLVASLIAAEAIVTTEAKAKALRPVAEKLITKAKKGGLHRTRDIEAYLGDKEMTYKLVARGGAPLRRAPGWVHPHPQARSAPRRQRAHGPHRAGLAGATGEGHLPRMTLFEPEPDEAAVQRVRLLVAYDGSGFHGFAENAGVATVGGTLAAPPGDGAARPGRADLCRPHRHRRPRLGAGGQLRRAGRRSRPRRACSAA